MEPLRDLSGCLSSIPGADYRLEVPGISQVESSFDGFGCNSVVDIGGSRGIRLRPKAARSPENTHAGLVLGPEVGDRISFSVNVTTLKQLREGGNPNPHEVGWVVWHYADNAHFYYLIPKPNGWELGKRDPAYQGGQRFIATGESPSAILGQPTAIRIVQNRDRIQAFMDGRIVADVRDEERPYMNGRVGFYCEDADVLFDSISLHLES